MRDSSKSASGSGLSTEDLLNNLLDSVKAGSSASGSSFSSSNSDSAASSESASTSSSSTATPSTPSTSSSSSSSFSGSASKSVTAEATSSGGGSNTGLSLGLALGALAVVIAIVFILRTRRKRRLNAPRRMNNLEELGTPQLSIELPQPPHRLKEQQYERRSSGLSNTSSHHKFGGESSMFHSMADASPSTGVGSKIYRVSNMPQTGPASMTYRMGSDAGASSPRTLGMSNAVGAGTNNNNAKLTRIVSNRRPSEMDPSELGMSMLPPPSLAAPPVPGRDTTTSVNSLHDSTCGDLYKHGDGLGYRAKKKQQQLAKQPSAVQEEDETSTGDSARARATTASSEKSPTTGSSPETIVRTPIQLYVPPTPTRPTTPETPRRPPPPLPPTGVAPYSGPSSMAAPATAARPSSTPPSVDLGDFRVSHSPDLDALNDLNSSKRISTASTDSSDIRAGSLIELKEVSGDGDGKEIEI